MSHTRLSDLGFSEASIKVKNSGIVRLQYFEDPPDGNLAIAENNKNIPFEVKRVYFINSLNNPKAVRGKHAHKRLKQVIFCINGSLQLALDDGETTQTIVMDNPYVGILLGNLLWHEMKYFSKNCVILVLADDYYNNEDYIRDYEEFSKYSKSLVIE